MRQLDSWEGPDDSSQGCRYCKTVGWMNIYILIKGSELWGGLSGPGKSFEICREGGNWVRYETDLALNTRGDVQLVLKGGTTWAVKLERVSKGEMVDAKIESLEDLAAYLEDCASDR
jgi:hypothetical protein